MTEEQEKYLLDKIAQMETAIYFLAEEIQRLQTGQHEELDMEQILHNIFERKKTI